MGDYGAASVRPCEKLLLSTATLLWVVSATTLAVELNFTNDGPAILDSTITFRAEVLGGQFPELYYYFSHNVPHAQQPKEPIVNGTLAVLPMTFLSSVHPDGEYVMGVQVMKRYFFSYHKIAEGASRFLLTRDIVGRIVVTQGGHTLPDDQTIVSTNRTTNFTFELHDPSGYFKNSTSTLSWKLDYGSSIYAPYYTKNFTDTDSHSVFLVALITRPNSKSPMDIKFGSFARTITPKDPITSVSVQGNVWLRRGDVVSLQVSCNGSAPYHYCWKYLPGNATSNSTANLTCDEPISTNQCQFPLVHYFPQDGSHFIAILLSNVVQLRPYIKNIEVHIYDVPSTSLLSTIILPITCSLLAFVILVTGIAYHIHTRNRLHVEVADFDFQRPDLELTEKTFWEHLLGAWRDAFPSFAKGTLNSAESAGTIGEEDSLAAPPSDRRYGNDNGEKFSESGWLRRGVGDGMADFQPSTPVEKTLASGGDRTGVAES